MCTFETVGKYPMIDLVGQIPEEIYVALSSDQPDDSHQNSCRVSSILLPGLPGTMYTLPSVASYWSTFRKSCH